MPAPRIAKTALVHVRRERPDMSPGHLALIRQLPCLGCGVQRYDGAPFVIDPDHIMHPDHGFNSRGIGRKSADRWTIPMCRGPFGCANCHDAAQQCKLGYEAWFAERGIDARAVANALWSGTDDLLGMERIIFRARQDAALKAAAMRETT